MVLNGGLIARLILPIFQIIRWCNYPIRLIALTVIDDVLVVSFKEL